MKKFLFITIVFSLLPLKNHGQCDEKTTLQSHMFQEIKDHGILEVPIDATVIMDGEKITVTVIDPHNGEKEILESHIIQTLKCVWKKFPENGISRFKAMTRKGNEKATASEIIMEGKSGSTTLTYIPEKDNGTKIRFVIYH
ncbi:hypothetical protein [Sinomicrobium sp. M5D2P17]